MRCKLVLSAIALSLASGCANQDTRRTAWDIRPALEIRHGMAQAQALYQVGWHRQRHGDIAGAEEAYAEALVADPRHAETLNALGKIYAERGELDRAAAAFRRVAELAPEKAYLYNNIGYALFLDGRHAEAIDALRKALALNPEYERAWVNLRTVAERAGKLELAKLAAERRLPAGESLPSWDDGGAGTMADTAMAAIPVASLRMASSLSLLAADEKAVPSAASTIVLSEVDVKAVAPAVTITEVPYRKLAPDSSAWSQERRPAFITVAETSGQAMRLGMAKAVVAPPDGHSTASVGIGGRIEISNGNGLSRFATRLGKQLRKEGVHVGRITNHASYKVAQTIIEYQPEWAEAAHALRERLGMEIVMREATTQRQGTDIRVILGRDSLERVATLMSPPAGNPAIPLQLSRNSW